MSDWQPVVGYVDRYEVSRFGVVRSVRGQAVGQWLNNQGYSLVRLSRPRAIKRVHRLVAEAFLANPGKLPGVNHLDHNRANNDVANLEWCDQARNLAHAREAGRLYRHPKGKRSPAAKLPDSVAFSIRAARTATGESWGRLAAQFGVSKRSVGRILRGESYV